jgi:MFS family permease
MWPAARAYVADLDRRFGRSALSAIVVMTFVNAVADGNAHFFAQFYCKLDLQLPPSEAQGMLIPLRGAWALKPLWGTLTDAFPLCGYRYKPYVGLMGALGCIAMVLLFSLPPSTALAACCFLMVSICTGWVDVLCNAVITSACRAEADGGRKGAADLQAMSIAVFAVGSLVGNALGGLMFTLSGGSARQCFGFSALFPAALLLLARSMDEPKAAPSSGSGSSGGSRLESVRGAYAALRPGGAGGGAVLQAALFVALSAAIVPVLMHYMLRRREREEKTITLVSGKRLLVLPGRVGLSSWGIAAF